MIRCNSCFNIYNEEFGICPECGYYSGKEEEPIYRLPHGTIVKNRYMVGKTIGHGGFGITYKAWDMTLETVVAVKEFYPIGMVNRVPGSKEMFLVSKKEKKDFNNSYERFLDEARNMAKFNGHANIVNAFEYFEENGTAYIVMEFLQGMDLKHYLNQQGEKLDTTSCINIITEVCKALESLHQKSIIHRDISTDNIFICNDGRVKVIDFGAARFADGDDTNLDIILKPGYAPAEQYDKVKPQGPWTDIYALGATMYRMITGQMPEESTNRVIEDKVLYPHEIDNQIPFNISCSIMKAMAVERHMRFSNMDEFRKALLGEKKVMHLAVEKKKRKRKRLLTIASAIVVLMVGYGVFSWRWNVQKEEETLPEATIEIWYVNDEYEEGKAKAFDAIAEAFIESYPDVTIKIKGIEEAEYTETLDEARKSDKAPEIYEVYEGCDTDGEKVEDIVKTAQKNIVMYKQILNHAKKTNSLAFGFKFPIVYINRGKEDVDKLTLKDTLKLLDIDNIEEKTDLEDFLAGDEKYYIGYNSDFAEIQKKLQARMVQYAAPLEVECLYAMEFSINKCSEDELKCATRFLEYCYNANAQAKMFVDNQNGALPLNGKALEQYEKYYNYTGFFEKIEKYTIN